MRTSHDEIDQSGRVWNGFDYTLQGWVRDGIVQPCGHPGSMSQYGPCCASARYAGQAILVIPGAEVRREAERRAR